MRTTVTRRAELGLTILVCIFACGRADPPRLETSALPVVADAGGTTARFQLRNVGGRALAVDGVVPACGCAATSRLPAALGPGATSMLEVRCLPPHGGNDGARELRLRTSDPAHPEIPLRVSVGATTPGPDPGALYLGYVAVGETVVRDVVLPTAVTGLAPPALAELTLEPLPVRADGAHGVRVRFAPRVAGIVRTTIDLGAGGRVAVSAVGYDGAMAFPAEVRLPRPSGAAGWPVVTLMGLAEAPLAISRVEYPPGVTGELRTVVSGRQYRLLLRGRPSSPAAAIRVYGEAAPILGIPIIDGDAGDPGRPAA